MAGPVPEEGCFNSNAVKKEEKKKKNSQKVAVPTEDVSTVWHFPSTPVKTEKNLRSSVLPYLGPGQMSSVEHT